MTRPSRLPAIILLCIITLVGAASAQTDLSPIFDEPTLTEIAALRADWHTRPTEATDLIHERYSELDGFTISRASFYFEGYKQYVMVRYPLNYSPEGSYPVMVYHHGGESGIYYSSAISFDETFTTSCVADSAFVLAPTYRGEAFVGGDYLGNRMSEGPVSLWDRDCDDAMAVLTAFLAVTPEADTRRITSFGRSRGATVAYHMAVRDIRLRRSVVMFGASDFRHENILQDCQLEVDEGIEATNTLSRKVMANIVGPWLAGEMSLEDARHLLTGWSIRYTLHGNLKFQLHHGDADDAIVIDHAILVDQIMQNWGAGLPEYEFFSYPGGGHNPAGLDGYEERVEGYICLEAEGGITAAPVPEPMTSIKVWPNPFTTRVQLEIAEQVADKSNSTGSTIWILDLRGRLVQRLEADSGSTGHFTWDGFDQHGATAPAGVYLAIPNNPGPGAEVGEGIQGKRILKLR